MSKFRIVVGVDGSPGAAAAVAWCTDIATGLAADVTAVYTLPPLMELVPPAAPPSAPVYYSEETRRELQEQLEGRCEAFRTANVPYEAVIAEGRPAEALVRVAEDLDATMIVVGRRGAGGFAELVLGSVPHQLSHHSPRPVVVVPAR